MQDKDEQARQAMALNGKAPAMTRMQKRANERANIEAKEAFGGLVQQFWTIFFDNTPEDQIVTDKEKEVIAKWKMYCQRRRLKPECLNMVYDACKTIREDYEKTKAE